MRKLRQGSFVVRAGNSKCPKLIVYKVAMRCTNIKFTSTAYNTSEKVKKGN